MMKSLPGNVLRIVYSLILLFVVTSMGISSAYAQKQTVKKTGSGVYYLEFLPKNYKSSGSQKSPVIIFLHGLGERQNGSSMTKVRKLGPPKHIENGHNMTFKANASGKEYSFVVISPQLTTNKSSWDAKTIDGVVNHVLSKYNVDKDRVYLTGLSLGGGGVWTYVTSSYNKSNKIAAIAPVAGFLGSTKSKRDTKFLAEKNVPVWAFHNKGDKVVPLSMGKAPIDGLKSYKPKISPRFTVYNSSSHNAWTNAYATNHSKHSPNVYEWLLAQKRGGGSDSSPANEAPVANAGSDKTIKLPTNSITLNASSSTDDDGSIKKYKWQKVSGPSVSISSSSSAKTTAKSLKQGSYVFRLTVTDNDGATDTDDMKVTVLKKEEAVADDDQDDDNGSGNDNSSVAAVKINFNELSANNASGWNNLNFAPKANKSKSNLKNVKNSSTGISIRLLSSWSDSNQKGYNSKKNSGIYPDKVTKSYFYTNGTEQIEISGLNKNTSYSFTFFGSSMYSGNRTAVYTIGSKKASLNAANNKSGTAKISSVKSNSSGKVTITVSKASGARYAFLGAMVIDPSSSATADSGDSSSDDSSSKGGSSSSATTAVKVNFNELSENNASGWNNLNFAPKKNHSRSNLKDVDGNRTGIYVKMLSNWDDSNDKGYSTKSNSAVFPDKVISSYFYTTGTETIKIGGLDKNTKYNFSFYASSWYSGNRNTEYQIGSKKATLNASYNKNNVATISGVTTSSGYITLTVKRPSGSRYGYLGAMIIEPKGSSSARMATTKGATTNLAVESSEVNEIGNGFVEVNAYPNPVLDHVAIEMSGEIGEAATISIIDALGRVVYSKEQTMSGYAETYDVDVNALGLKPGLVFLKVTSPTYGEKVVKLIKK